MYRYLEKDEKDEAAELFAARLLDNGFKKVSRDGNIYIVRIQEQVFSCLYKEMDIRRMASVCLDILEELKFQANSGHGRAALERAKRVAGNVGTVTGTLSVYGTFSSDRLKEKISSLEEAARVGKRYSVRYDRNRLIRGIYCVYDMMVDRFDNDEAYVASLFFLMRVAMGMRSRLIEAA